jgi:ribose transport system substrate-binding protein
MRDTGISNRLCTCVWLVILSGLVIVGSGCGSDSDKEQSAQSDGSFDLTRVTDRVNSLLDSEGTYQSPPTTSPKPAPGIKIALISCGQAYTACSVPIEAAKNAAQALGWKATIFDDKGDPTLAGTGIRSAIASGVDAIFVYYIDCKYIKQPLQEANDAGVLVAGGEVFDCNEGGSNGPKLFDYITTYSGGIDGPYGKATDYETYISDFARAQADYAIAKLNGKAKMLVFGDDTGVGSQVVARSYIEELGNCPECEGFNIEFPYSELATGLRPRAEQELLKHPDVNSIASTYDAITLAGVSAAADASARDLVVIVGEGGPAGADLIREGKGTAGAGLPLGWEAYAALDALNRMLQDQMPVETGIGLQLYDAEHNLPPEGGYKPPFDYAEIYEKTWARSAG